MKLRQYQTDCRDAVRLATMKGVKRQLIVLPTAGGKTIIFSEMPRALNMRRPERMLVLVQSDELCFQSVDKLQKQNPELKIGLEKAQYKSTWSDDIVVASVQTLAGTKMGADGEWDWGPRLRTLDPATFRYIIIDEAHHVTADNYHAPMRYFGVMKNEPKYNDSEKFLLGVTATPNRTDNKGLESFFQKIVYQKDIRSMIAEGWLAEPRAYRVDTMVSLAKVGTRGGDYIDGQLSKAVNTPERNSLIVDKYLELGEGAPFIALTVDIQHTVDLTEMFRSRAVTCFGIASKNSSKSPWLVSKEKERAETIRLYNDGKFLGLISCQALMEGFDAPRATVVLWARPTKSGLLYVQGTGRVLRPYPAPEALEGWTGWEKQYAIVIDFVDNVAAVGTALMTAPTLFGLRPDFNMKGKKALEVLDEIEKIKAAQPNLDVQKYADLDALRAVSQRIDLFAVPVVSNEIKRLSPYAWMTGASAGSWQLSILEKGMLRITENALGEFEVSRHLTGIRTMIGIAKTLAEALKIGDKAVPPEAMIVLKSDANWRRLPVTSPQIGALCMLYPEMRRPFASRADFEQMVHATYDRGSLSILLEARDKRGQMGV